jgi:hypothetical protein
MSPSRNPATFGLANAVEPNANKSVSQIDFFISTSTFNLEKFKPGYCNRYTEVSTV